MPETLQSCCVLIKIVYIFLTPTGFEHASVDACGTVIGRMAVIANAWQFQSFFIVA